MYRPPQSPPHDALLLRSQTRSYLDALDRVRRYARHDGAAVLLEGESGTGKTLFARYLHACAKRANRPFVAVNLAALDDALASSELFGHVPGAFTGALRGRQGAFAFAHGGTLFLDEIGRASKAVQGKLLHAVEDGCIHTLGTDLATQVDVRVVAATSTPLRQLVGDDSFLLDLWMRLAGFVVRIPALRERADDIPMLVRALVERAAPGHGYRVPPAIDVDVMDCLRCAPWPGNVRQLTMAVDAMLLDADGADRLTLAHCRALDLDSPLPRLMMSPAPVPSPPSMLQLRTALAQELGNKTRAARRLGVSRTTVYRWLEAGEDAVQLEG